MASGQPTGTTDDTRALDFGSTSLDEAAAGREAGTSGPAGDVPETPSATGGSPGVPENASHPDGKKARNAGQGPKAEKKPKKVYEAGGVIVCDGKVVVRFSDGQNWIFPKGKLKKHESPEDAAIREAVEETGLTVEIVGEAGELIMKADGKKRRFVFYLMRALDKTWDWPHHEGRDTFLMDADRVGSLLRKGYRPLWEACEERVRALAAESPSPLPPSPTGDGGSGEGPREV